MLMSIDWDQVLPLLFQSTLVSNEPKCLPCSDFVFYIELFKGLELFGELYLEGAGYCWVL